MDYTWALNQIAVYWERLDPDGYGGWIWEDPIEVACRWVEKNEEMFDEAGNKFISKAEILVNQDMKPGDMLYLGDLDGITSASGSPANTKSAYVVRKFSKIPDILAEEYVRKAWL